MEMVLRAFTRRVLLAAVVLAGAATFGFSQSNPPSSTSGHPSETGVLVVTVQSGSPAERAGIVRGDIITDVNGAAVESPHDIRQAISAHKQGDTIEVKVRHGDEQKTLSVALGEKNGRPYMGVLLFPVEQWRLGSRGPEERGLPWMFTEGAFIARVVPGGPAAKAGIKRGDIILSVDGISVDGDHSLGSLIEDKKAGDTVTLSVRAVGEPDSKTPKEVTVTLGTSPDKKTAWLGVECREPVHMTLLPWWGGFPPAAELNPWDRLPPSNEFLPPSDGFLAPDMGPVPDAPVPPGARSPSGPPQPII
jgi:S1-C subfamily serine protease